MSTAKRLMTMAVAGLITMTAAGLLTVSLDFVTLRRQLSPSAPEPSPLASGGAR